MSAGAWVTGLVPTLPVAYNDGVWLKGTEITSDIIGAGGMLVHPDCDLSQLVED